MKQKILIADDERDIIDFLKYNLDKEGFDVLTARNGTEALTLAKKKPDLILLDIMMPEMDGLEVVRSLKKNSATANIPVIFLTAKSAEIDEVVGLELGADDYITKPVSIPKLIARIKLTLRKRSSSRKEDAEPSDIMKHGILEINRSHYKVFVNKKEVFFPKKEFEVLSFLVKNSGKVVTRETLLSQIWGSDVYVIDRTVDVHIRKIREKLGSNADYIDTIKGVGYRMKEI
ncbi:MAG: response regulator transcription factor [Bacteroidota bacterium]|jgi:two-component system alkaline phosphatase synthesis response regulator PhoP